MDASEPGDKVQESQGPEVTGEQPAPVPAEQPAEAGRARYQIVTKGEHRVVVCGNAPNISLRVERGLTVNEAGRKHYPAQTVFLDGVYSGPPFYDNKARQYSLDHHAGCVRAYTLATCEQAVVLVLQGLPLSEGDWTLYINDPDLDALLSAWVLMNHVELLQEDEQILRGAMPLIRVEGVIDAHGTDMAVLTALPPETYEDRKREIDRLLAQERSYKAAGQWSAIDWIGYTRDMLQALDHLLFPEGYLTELLEIEELGRVSLGAQKMAILCRSHQGIYAVETALKARYEKQVGIIVLDLDDGRFTLRQVDPFLDQDLTAVYRALNAKDLRARQDSETDNLWGGSADIGGSPRKTGSALSGQEILQIIQRIYVKPTNWFGRLFRRMGG
jgi:hypothetical protein